MVPEYDFVKFSKINGTNFTKRNLKGTVWSAVADQGGARNAPPGPNVNIFMQFSRNIGQLGWRPLGEILDPPLVSVHT